MKHYFTLLSEVTGYFDSYFELPKECRYAVFQRDVLDVLVRTNNKIVEQIKNPKKEKFKKRYLSQCMIGVPKDDMQNLLARISPEQVITRGYFSKELKKNRIPLGFKKYTIIPESFDIPCPTIFASKTPFGNGHLTYARTQLYAYDGKIEYAQDKFSLLTVRNRDIEKNRWVLPTYRNIFNVLDSQTIQDKELVAKVIKEFFEIPIPPEFCDNMGKVKRNELVNKAIDDSIG